MSDPRKHRPPPSGFTLIEVLIALLVLSIGLLGLASLQTSGLRLNDSAYLRSQAVLAGYDLIDRIRLERKNAPDYDTSGNFVDKKGDVSVKQFKDWVGTHLSRLPGGAAKVACTESPYVCTVQIRWDESRASRDNNKTQTFTIETRI